VDLMTALAALTETVKSSGEPRVFLCKSAGVHIPVQIGRSTSPAGVHMPVVEHNARKENTESRIDHRNIGISEYRNIGISAYRNRKGVSNLGYKRCVLSGYKRLPGISGFPRSIMQIMNQCSVRKQPALRWPITNDNLYYTRDDEQHMIATL